MKPTFSALTISLVCLAAVAAPTSSQTMDAAKLVAPGEIRWGPAPPSMPTGAQATVLFGDPGKEGLFAMRLKLPKGYRIAPHSHPKPEVVTVISGAIRLGLGEKADPSNAKLLPAGSFFVAQPGVKHFVFTDEETVLQLNAVGPWGLTYVDPNDDPRKKTQ